MPSADQTLFQLVRGLSGRNFIADGLGVFFAKYLAYLLVAGFLLLAYYEDGWRKKSYVFLEGAIAVMLARGLVTEIIRFFYHHERPFSFYSFAPLISESGWSFPSGHAAFFFALSMTVWYVNRRWGAWFFVLSAVMGLARVYAGVHWPFDIIGGAAVGALSAVFIHRLLEKSREELYYNVKADVQRS